ncbi:MAG TPA: hypothetical protein PLV68_16170 [Ilumatobacteraceae bacterium]|nr:hypothetical protein [Ilumatobacteraceae bacterium]
MTEHTSTQPEQLRLLDGSDVPLAFRLDERTRRRGLAHIAELRTIIARQAAARHLSAETQAELHAVGSRRPAA